MGVFDNTDWDAHESVCFAADAATGLRAVIALHSTALGPAGGGVRFRPYASSEDALSDALRLSRAMTAKMALAGLPFGGGKAVIIGDPRADKTAALLEAFGRVVEGFGGRYICGEDVGTTPQDMAIINRATRHVAGLPETSGDTAPATAHGVFQAMRAAVRRKLGREDFAGLRVAVQGLGSVGYRLCVHLADHGAILTVADVNDEAVARAVAALDATAVPSDRILAVDADVLAPCALGGVLDAASLAMLRAPVICGAANNQLADGGCAAILAARGILFVPDFLANAGGVISATGPFLGVGEAETERKVAAIFETCDRLLALAERDSITPSDAAERLVAEALKAKRPVGSMAA